MSTYILCHSGTELYHHGILGQKWGVRRYQNKDGSYTPQGIIRYERNNKKYANKIKKYSGKINRLSKKQVRYTKKLSNGDGTFVDSPAKLGKKSYKIAKKNKRLSKKINRMQRKEIRNRKYIDYMLKESRKVNPKYDADLNALRDYYDLPFYKRINKKRATAKLEQNRIAEEERRQARASISKKKMKQIVDDAKYLADGDSELMEQIIDDMVFDELNR